MREHNGKRAVIISNIKSNSIEQAIFILKPKQTEPVPADLGGGIVAEAQEIINSYINKIENRKSEKDRRRMQRVMTALAVSLCLVLAITAAALFFA